MAEEKVILSKKTYDSMVSEISTSEKVIDEQYARIKAMSEGRKEIAFKTNIPIGLFSECTGLLVSCDSDSIIAITIDECAKLRERSTKLMEEINARPRVYSSEIKSTRIFDYKTILAISLGFILGFGLILFL